MESKILVFNRSLSVLIAIGFLWLNIQDKKYIPEDIPYEGIIGKVRLIDCIKTSPEFYDKVQKENKDIYAKSVFNQDYAWQMEVIEVYDNPIKAKGKLRLWNYEGGVNGKEE